MSARYKITDKPLVFRKLLEDAPNIERDFKIFKETYRSLLGANHPIKAEILQCHLAIEFYPTQYLEAANPALPNIADVRLSFAQKLKLADHPQANFHFLMPGMEALNSIRNKIAHRLDFIPKENDLAPIRKCLKVWHTAARKLLPQGQKIIGVFAETVCAFLHGDTKAIQRHGGGMGLAGLLNWWQNEPGNQTSANNYRDIKDS